MRARKGARVPGTPRTPLSRGGRFLSKVSPVSPELSSCKLRCGRKEEEKK